MSRCILLYSKLYFALGQRGSDGMGDILPTLIAVADSAAGHASIGKQ